MGGKGGWAILQVLGGGGAGVRAMEPRLVEARVERDIRDIEDTQPGEERPAPPILELGVGEPRPLSSSSSSTTSSSMATLQYGTCRGHQYEQHFPATDLTTDLSDDGHELVDLPGLTAHQLPAAGVQGGGVTHKQHIAPRLLRGLERALSDEEVADKELATGLLHRVMQLLAANIRLVAGLHVVASSN